MSVSVLGDRQGCIQINQVCFLYSQQAKRTVEELDMWKPYYEPNEFRAVVNVKQRIKSKREILIQIIKTQEDLIKEGGILWARMEFELEILILLLK